MGHADPTSLVTLLDPPSAFDTVHHLTLVRHHHAHLKTSYLIHDIVLSWFLYTYDCNDCNAFAVDCGVRVDSFSSTIYAGLVPMEPSPDNPVSL